MPNNNSVLPHGEEPEQKRPLTKSMSYRVKANDAGHDKDKAVGYGSLSMRLREKVRTPIAYQARDTSFLRHAYVNPPQFYYAMAARRRSVTESSPVDRPSHIACIVSHMYRSPSTTRTATAISTPATCRGSSPAWSKRR